MPAPLLHDLACVVHLHSTYSDGTGTVAQIARAGAKAGADVVLLTDHDTLEARSRGEEGWHGSVLLLVGEEVSPERRNHYLAFGLDEPIDHSGLDSAGIVRAVNEAGGFGFAAHPFSKGSERFARLGDGMPFHDIEAAGLAGVELWSFVTDTGESLGSVADVARFITRPLDVLDHPPARNMEAWDRLCASTPTVAIGGIDAHQIGMRVAGHVPLRLMGYARSFAILRTHVLCEELPNGELEHDREQVYAALRAGRCYIAVDALAPARGFAFWAEHTDGRTSPMGAQIEPGEWTLRATVPRPAELRLFRDGVEIAREYGAELSHPTGSEPGVYRVTAVLERRGRDRTWVISNPVYSR
ncbi:MAG: CehA/McbA family metallohydrolase [Thermoleophilaceae bacterium]